MNENGGTIGEPYFRADDKWMWVYEMSMWKNPTIFFTVIKVFGGIVLAMSVLMFFITLQDGAPAAGALFLRFFGYGMLITLALLIPSYIIAAMINGGKYCVIFEMDENGVKHIQCPKQVQKAQVVADLAVQTGLSTNIPLTMGTGLRTGAKSESVSQFAKVRKIVVKRAYHTILVNQSMEHNQVYANAEHFDEVLGFIVSHCPRAKIHR